MNDPNRQMLAEGQIIIDKLALTCRDLAELVAKAKGTPGVHDGVKIYLHAVGCAFTTACCAAGNREAALELGGLCLLFNETGSNPEATKFFGPTK